MGVNMGAASRGSNAQCVLLQRQHGGAITGQLRRLGASCDWSRERFTLDSGLSGEGTQEGSWCLVHLEAAESSCMLVCNVVLECRQAACTGKDERIQNTPWSVLGVMARAWSGL